MTKARVIHFLAATTVKVSDSMHTPARSVNRGDEIEVTPEVVAYNTDRNGNSWLNLTEEEQLAKWGKLIFAEGEKPEGVNFWDGDSFTTDKLRENLRHAASQIIDETEKRAALAAIRGQFGMGSSQSTTEYSTDNFR